MLNTILPQYMCVSINFIDSVTSSEKVDKEHRYSDFSIVSMPYPGCEFFREWRENSYQAEALMFDWNQVLNDTKTVTYFKTSLQVSKPVCQSLNILDSLFIAGLRRCYFRFAKSTHSSSKRRLVKIQGKFSYNTDQ